MHVQKLVMHVVLLQAWYYGTLKKDGNRFLVS